MRNGQGIVKTKYINRLLMVFLGGIVLARRLEFNNEYNLVWCIVAVTPLLCYKSLKLSKLSLLLLFLLLGLWRGTNQMNHLKEYNSLLRHKVTIIAKAKSDAVYSEHSQLEFEVGNFRVIDPIRKHLIGAITIRGYGTPMIYKDDIVQVTAKIYPTRGSKQAVMSFAKIEVLKRDKSVINNLRRYFSSGMHSAIPEPLSSFGLGLLIGQRATLPEEVNQQLSKVGLTHIVAVSGYNLTILIQFVLRLFSNRSKYQLTVFTILFIGLFLLITGFSASIVRASVVSLLSIWAWFYGRKFRALMLLLLSASLTAGFYPIYIWSDIGWYLSFLAFFGILVIAPTINSRFFNDKPSKILRQLLTETFSAQILTLPLILYIFGKLSLFALAANMLVVPFVSIAMGFCFVSGIVGAMIPSMAGWFSFPTVLVLNYMLDVTKMISQIPMASIEIQFTLLQTIFCYALILFVVLVWWNKLSIGDKIKI